MNGYLADKGLSVVAGENPLEFTIKSTVESGATQPLISEAAVTETKSQLDKLREWIEAIGDMSVSPTVSITVKGLLGLVTAASLLKSLGGKTGVNFDKYKNIIGVIRQPEFTYLNPHVLHSLPRRDFLSGAAEMLKTFIISDNGNYAKACDYISSYSDETDSLEELIEAAARVKAEVVSCDQFEKGRRRLLNLGHTFAHAIETLARRKAEEMKTSETASQALEYDITHGEAVAMGIILAARLAEAVSAENEDIKVAKGLAATLEADFRACKMRVDCPFTIEEMAPIMTKDKKAEGGIIHFVLPLSIGNVTTLDLTATHVAEIMK